MTYKKSFGHLSYILRKCHMYHVFIVMSCMTQRTSTMFDYLFRPLPLKRKQLCKCFMRGKGKHSAGLLDLKDADICCCELLNVNITVCVYEDSTGEP